MQKIIKHQKILIYKSNHSYPPDSTFMSEQDRQYRYIEYCF